MNQTLLPQEQHRPPGLVEVLDSVWLLDSHLSRDGWRYMWHRYSPEELVEIARRSGWFDSEPDQQILATLGQRALDAGYSPQGVNK